MPRKEGTNINLSRTPKNSEKEPCNVSNSETTIYQNAVEFQNDSDDNEIVFKKRDSSLSGCPIDTSDECIIDKDYNEGIVTGRPEREKWEHRPTRESAQAKMVREAEASKATMFRAPGNIPIGEGINCQSQSVDDNYLVIGLHVDEIIQSKIINHQYIDFARLLPRDHIAREDDQQCLEIVSKDGKTFFSPISECETMAITNFNKWEQAFRIFSNIYTRAYPDRVTQLIQYNHIIYTAALTFSWDNMYMYDCEFRMHLSNYPQHSWAVILQQAWSMYLKD